ncbi:hypothetical protein Vadar_017495 [Vaccinium darrowii]|uniref:Uncharacterized protein n=1 Tax=Vaccinium darrowii TaxID=229202 RepID=A0ACB7YF99_9ERIC|nr:hypothetical protein Vadar_017495 [Vaccinium darrowii]
MSEGSWPSCQFGITVIPGRQGPDLGHRWPRETPEDVDKLRSVGVKTIFCLQQDPDLEYFGVDISAIREYDSTHNDIEHLRAEMSNVSCCGDFDSFDLRMRLPAVVSKLHKAINRNGGVTCIHCTAGLGRAPAVAVCVHV